MAVSEELLSILRCPESGQTLRRASDGELDVLRSRIDAGEIVRRSGQPLSTAFDGALIREDGRLVFAVWGGIPDLILEDALVLRD